MINQFDPHNRPMLEGIQGNILKSHGRHHTANLFIRCYPDGDCLTNAKSWLRSLVTTGIVQSAYAQLRSNALFKESGGKVDTGLFACIHISADGYRYLFPDDTRLDNFEVSFRDGMKSATSTLSDPPATEWEPGFGGEQQFMLLLAHADPAQLEEAIKTTQQAITSFGLITTLERGEAQFNAAGAGIEHFGYVDGISQPLFFDDEWEHFKEQNHIKAPKSVLFDPRADKSLVLIADPFATDSANAQGSYFVFRKLEQNVQGFKRAEADLATRLKLMGEDRERAGAMLVGRFEDGTPVQVSDEAGLIGSATINNFDYPVNDGAAKCPFHAHIRKSNPRFGSPKSVEQVVVNHVMARRGITYGTRTDDPNDGQLYNKPEGGVGLLFMSYQSSITDRFEFIQKDWVNRADFPSFDPNHPDGVDLVIGQGTGTRVGNYATEWGAPGSIIADPSTNGFAQFVTMKGGEYFFAPSMVFLENL